MRTVPRSLLLLALAIGVLGCGAKSAPKSQDQVASEKPWQEMKSKLDTMTPEQRAQYLKEHPEELANLGKSQPTKDPE